MNRALLAGLHSVAISPTEGDGDVGEDGGGVGEDRADDDGPR